MSTRLRQPIAKYQNIIKLGMKDRQSAKCNEAGSGNDAEDREHRANEGAPPKTRVSVCSDPKEAGFKNDAKHEAAAAKRCVKYRWYLLRQDRR